MDKSEKKQGGLCLEEKRTAILAKVVAKLKKWWDIGETRIFGKRFTIRSHGTCQ